MQESEKESARLSRMDQFAGYKFHPSEIDLVNYYLRPKVDDQPLPYPGIIHEVNFYQNGPNWLSGKFFFLSLINEIFVSFLYTLHDS